MCRCLTDRAQAAGRALAGARSFALDRDRGGEQTNVSAESRPRQLQTLVTPRPLRCGGCARVFVRAAATISATSTPVARIRRTSARTDEGSHGCGDGDEGGGGRRGGGGGGGVPVPSAVGGRRTGGTSCAFSSVLRSNSSSILLNPNRTVVRRSNGSRLSCGRNARRRKAAKWQTKRLASKATQFLPTCERPTASSAC